jgi:hypothetical protein
VKAITGPTGWLEAEWLDGQTHEVERPARTRRRSTSEPAAVNTVASRSVDARNRRAGVRGAIVAMKPGNAGGAKGSRKMDAT